MIEGLFVNELMDVAKVLTLNTLILGRLISAPVAQLTGGVDAWIEAAGGGQLARTC